MSRRAQLPQGTQVGSPEHVLKSAALTSVKLPLVDGVRPGDPLNALVTYATVQEWAPVANLVIGRHIPGDWQGEVMAARVRAALRRWAVKQ